MIEIKPKQPILKPKSEAKHEISTSIPFYAMDSTESDWIKQKIKSNKEYLSKCTSKSLYQKVEKDTLYLENHILPIIQAKTNLFYNDLAKKFISSLDDAFQKNCNAIVVYLPINENYSENPKAGIANYGKENPLKCEVRADLYLYNKDSHAVPFECVELF